LHAMRRQRFGERVIGLVVFETVAKSLTGQNENDAATVNQIAAGMQRIQEATGGHVLASHHTGKDTAQGSRGSAAFQGDFAATFEVRRISDKEGKKSNDDLREFWVRKQRDGEDEIHVGTFRLGKRVLGQDGKGKDITSMICEWLDGQGAASDIPALTGA